MEPELPPDDDGQWELPDLPPDDDGDWMMQPKRKRMRLQSKKFEGRNIEEVMREEVIPHRMPELWWVTVPAQLNGTIQDDFMEVYSPPRMVPLAVKAGMRASMSMDLLTGWNFLSRDARILAVQEIKARRPKVLMLSPPCTMFSGLMNMNWSKLEPTKRELALVNGTNHLEFSMLLADLQDSSGRGWCFEHPDGARSWKNKSVRHMAEQAHLARLDQCMFGLKSKVDQVAMKKCTRLLTNMREVHTALHHRMCDKCHTHRSIQGSEGGGEAQCLGTALPTSNV